ncbi:hypothetical protein QTO34_014824 [Cnephaeus nilssonii]|uniref:Uncharacterized protein n=1 Tax=Cnephaeus nilssonii TaxID=3371016 RepID=A0AA40I795_CNENI|nr:hypothetical protein QTO34_014824 [Eptesicus nilssonii]
MQFTGVQMRVWVGTRAQQLGVQQVGWQQLGTQQEGWQQLGTQQEESVQESQDPGRQTRLS